MKFRIDVDDRAARRALRDLLRRGEDLSPVLRSVGELLVNASRARFDAQRSPEGAAWEPLKPRTLARKKRNRDKILTERGQLRGTLAVGRVDADSVVVGSPEKYAATPQFGRGAIPARPFLGVSDADARGIREEILDFLADSFR